MIGQILSLASPILDKFVPDADTKMKLTAELETQLISLQAAQAATNLEQAKHPSIFVSGASRRSCGFAL